MTSEEILNDIANKHKVYVRRPLWEIIGIISCVVLVCGLIFTPIAGGLFAIGNRAVSHNYSTSYIESDQRGCELHTVHPLRFSPSVEHVQPQVSYIWGLINVNAGPRELKYYMTITLEDGTEFKAEVKAEDQNKMRLFGGLEIDYLVGRYSGRYYIKGVRVGDAKKNGLKARILKILTQDGK